MDLDEVADELYEVPPEEFIALRKARQDEARADGDKALVQEIGALHKPSSAAWVCNLLVRHEPDEIAALVELGGLVREAQESLAGDQVRALDVQRRQLIAALTRQARSLAYDRGHAVSSAVATQVEETLRAAMADPEAGEALLSGRLTAPMSYSGMGTTVVRPELRLVPPPTPERSPEPDRTTRKGDAGARRRAREEEARRAAEERHRQELAQARRAAQEATALADEAQAAAERQRDRVDELDARRAELQARVTELAEELAGAEREATEAVAELKRAERRRQTAERQVDDAVAARDAAVAHAQRLGADASDDA
jgi:hypothetical protein